MEISDNIVNLVAIFFGVSTVSIYAIFAKIHCENKLDKLERKKSMEFDKLKREKKELEFKYFELKKSQEKLMEVDDTIITDFILRKKKRLINENDKLINDLINKLINDYFKKSCIKLEDEFVSYEEKYAILTTIDNLKEYDIFNSNLIKSLVIAIIYSKRHQLQEKIVGILKNVENRVAVNTAVLDYYVWTNFDSLKYLVYLLEYTWDDINVNRLDDLIDSLKNRESTVLEPLKVFREKHFKTLKE